MTSDPGSQNNPFASPVSAELDLTQWVPGNNAFAVEFYRRMCEPAGNLFFSPASLSIALTMLYAGACGETAREIAQTLPLSLAPDPLPPAVSGLWHTFQVGARAEQAMLTVAQALWIQEGPPLLPHFSEVINAYGQSALHTIDFGATESARLTINRWVEQQTANKITGFIEPGLLDARTRLVLTVAIYFKGKWDTPFDTRMTVDQEFHVSSTRKVWVPLMQRTGRFRYFTDHTLSALELPYQGQDFSMVLLLPHTPDGLPGLEQSLTPARVDDWLSRLQRQSASRVLVSLPKYKITSQLSLTEPLRQMGMRQAFEAGGADFSGITGRHDLFLSAAIQKAYVE